MTNISQLNTAQIEAINAFLVKQNQSAFTEAQINFLTNIDDLDVLGLAAHCNLIRGYLGCFSHLHPHPLYQNQNGVNYDDLMDEFIEEINKESYGLEEYNNLTKNQREKYKAQMAHHGIILSSGTGRSDVLFLNKEYQPVFLKHIIFNG